MKAGFLTAIGKIEVKNVPDPHIQAEDEVLLKVERMGVCGSDIHYFNDGRIGTQVVPFPFRIGHEFSATVVETGRAVRRVKKGDKVAVDPAVFCGTCDQCRAGRFNTCRTLTFMGSPGLKDGCLAEYVVVPERSCFPSKKLALDELCLVEPLSIAVYAAGYTLPLDGKTVGILGAGPIGLSVLLTARACRAGNIYVTDKIEHRCKIAGENGATWTGNPLKTEIVAEVEKREPLLLDVVFECCGEQEAVGQALRLLKPGGFLVLVGIHTVMEVAFSTDLMRRREISIFNVRRQNESTGKALQLVEKNKLKAGFLITHYFPIADSQKAFDTVAGYRDQVLKAIIVP